MFLEVFKKEINILYSLLSISESIMHECILYEYPFKKYFNLNNVKEKKHNGKLSTYCQKCCLGPCIF